MSQCNTARVGSYREFRLITHPNYCVEFSGPGITLMDVVEHARDTFRNIMEDALAEPDVRPDEFVVWEGDRIVAVILPPSEAAGEVQVIRRIV